MPRHAEREPLGRILERFDRPVRRPGDLVQSGTDPAERLVVLARHGRASTEQTRETAPLANGDLVLGGRSRPVAVEVWRTVALREVLDDVAAAQNVEQLRTTADRENGHVPRERGFKQFHLLTILF